MSGEQERATVEPSHPERFQVVIAGGGVAALETALALRDLAGDRVNLKLIAPNAEGWGETGKGLPWLPPIRRRHARRTTLRTVRDPKPNYRRLAVRHSRLRPVLQGQDAIIGGGFTMSSSPAANSTPEPPELTTELIELDRDECLRLLASTNFGRIAVNVPDWPPVIRPVNYVFDEPSQSVLIRSNSGSKLHAILRSGKAAFEIDCVDPTGRTGWSVITVGVAEEITDSSELRRLQELGLEPWAPGERGHWVRIRTRTVSGRRIVVASHHRA
jgi:uncharacterized protein